jgi:hypothetical protein
MIQKATPVIVQFMRPVDIQQVGNELAIKWDEGGESFRY